MSRNTQKIKLKKEKAQNMELFTAKLFSKTNLAA